MAGTVESRRYSSVYICWKPPQKPDIYPFEIVTLVEMSELPVFKRRGAVWKMN